MRPTVRSVAVSGRIARAPPPGPRLRRGSSGGPGGGRCTGSGLVPRGVSGQFEQRERAVAPRRDQEVLAPGGGEETLQPVVVGIRRFHPGWHARGRSALFAGLDEVKRRGVDAHYAEELGSRDEDRELED